MKNVEQYNNLVNQHPKHLSLIETLFHQDELRGTLLRLSKEKIDIMSVPNAENAFVCVKSKDIKKFSKLGYCLIERNKILLLGVSEFLVDKDFVFAKSIANKINDKSLKFLAYSIIEDFEFKNEIENMAINGVEIIHLN